MPPPIDPAITSAYPKFAALHHDICSNRLNDDGTTKGDARTIKDQQAFAEDLHQARTVSARRQCVQDSLHFLASGRGNLPDELCELIALIAAYLGGEITGDDKDLVEDELEKNKDRRESIATALEQQLHQDVFTLSQMLALDEPPEIDDLPKAIAALQANVAASSEKLSQCRIELAQLMTSLHGLYRQATEASIRTLEQKIHGSISRSTKAKADHLAVVAEGMSKKLNVQHAQLMQLVHSQDMQELVTHEADEADRETIAVKREVRSIEEELAEYRRARGMDGMLREYVNVLGECEKIKIEIGRMEQ